MVSNISQSLVDDEEHPNYWSFTNYYASDYFYEFFFILVVF
jgi:hypothetical protein